MTEPFLEIVLCPGCGKRLPVRNSGACGCGWENPRGPIPRVKVYLSAPCSLNHVGQVFLGRIFNREIPRIGA